MNHNFLSRFKYKFLITIGIFTLPLLANAAATKINSGTNISPAQVLAHSEVEVTIDGVCKKINNTSVNTIIVPVKKAAEWDSFLKNLPSGITSGECGRNSQVSNSQSVTSASASVITSTSTPIYPTTVSIPPGGPECGYRIATKIINNSGTNGTLTNINKDPASGVKIDILIATDGNYSGAQCRDYIKKIYYEKFAITEPFKSNLNKINIWGVIGEPVPKTYVAAPAVTVNMPNPYDLNFCTSKGGTLGGCAWVPQVTYPFKAYACLTCKYSPLVQVVDPNFSNLNSINTSFGRVASVAKSDNPAADTIAVLSSATFRSYAYPGGTIFMSVPYDDVGYQELGNTFTHEFGHAFGYLKDEYVEDGRADQLGVNCRNVKDALFSYQGCSYSMRNWRSSEDSLMNNTKGEYNDVCKNSLLVTLSRYY